MNFALLWQVNDLRFREGEWPTSQKSNSFLQILFWFLRIWKWIRLYLKKQMNRRYSSIIKEWKCKLWEIVEILYNEYSNLCEGRIYELCEMRNIQRTIFTQQIFTERSLGAWSLVNYRLYSYNYNVISALSNKECSSLMRTKRSI